MKKRSIILPLSILLCLFGFKDTGKRSGLVTKVVIDAGHGGHDPGNLGTKTKKLKEKDISLNIALLVGEYIEKNIEGVEVIYTRDDDTFVELHERAGIANRANADCFISIHCNSATYHAYGTETYVMGLHKDEANLAVAKRENASILLEEDYEKHYDGFDPKSAEAHIIFSLFQNQYLKQSNLLASKVETEFATRAGRRSRGVKQAGFAVLYRTSMPSILVESGFLTNAKEETFLCSKIGQEYIASAVYRAFKAYKTEIEENQ